METKAQLLLAKIQNQKEEVAALRGLYEGSFPPEFLVADSQFLVWLRMYDFDTVAESIEVASTFYNRCCQMIEAKEEKGEKIPSAMHKTKLDIVKYASATMRDIKKDSEVA